MVNPGERVHLAVVRQLDVVATQRADRQEHQVGEPLVFGEHQFQAASAGDDPPVPAWQVSAVVAPFGSPVIWAGGVQVVVGSGAHPLRLVPDGSVPYCGVWLLLWMRAHWVLPAARQVCWRCDSAPGQRLVEVSAAGVPGIGVQPVSEQAAFWEAPCAPASVAVPRVSVQRFSGVQQHAVPQVLRERLAVPAVAEALRQRGWVRLEQEPVSAVLA